MATPDRSAVLSMLRARVARAEGRASHAERPPVSITEVVDEVLPDGGLARGAMHEVAPARGEEDSGAAFAFSALVSGRVGGTTIWIEPTPSIWPAGAKAFGLDPADLVVVAAHGADSLWAAEQALRCPGVGSCVLIGAIPDLTTSRRFQLAAEEGGVLGLAVTPTRTLASSSAARTRWRITSARGTGAKDYDLGDPTWRLELAAGKGCRPAAWDLRWDGTSTRLAPLDLPGVAEVRSAQEQRHEASG